MEKDLIDVSIGHVEYYVEVSKKGTVEYLVLKTDEKEVSPFIHFDDDLWEECEKIPEDTTWIKTVDTMAADPEDPTVGIPVKYKFSYRMVTEEAQVETKRKSVCSWCIYHTTTRMGRFTRHGCTHKKHLIKDFVRSMYIPGDCEFNNSYGECREFIELTGIDSITGIVKEENKA